VNHPNLFKDVPRLRKLLLDFSPLIPGQTSDQKKTSLAFTNFCTFLSSAKNLEVLALNMNTTLIYGSTQGAMNLALCLDELQISHYRVDIPLNKEQVIDFNKMEKLFEQIDYLSIKSVLFGNLFPEESKRAINFAMEKGILIDFEEIITRCSSLKHLVIDSLFIKNNIPQDIGLAKNLTHFTINFQSTELEELNTNLPILTKVLSQTTSLANFALQLSSPNEATVDELGNLHKMLAKLQIKHYTLKLWSNGLDMNHCITSPLFENLMHQLTHLQSLESLDLEFGQLETAEPFKIILGGFPTLKTLEISLLRQLPAFSTFPFEDLIHLKSIKKLVLLFAEFDKELVLKRLPKISSLDNVKIGTAFSSKERTIDSHDYKMFIMKIT